MKMVRRAATLTGAMAIGWALLGPSCGGSSNGGTTSTHPTLCAANAIKILFAPMYSAYDGVHVFQVPAVANGIDTTAITLNWSASDPSMVQFAPDPTTGGTMITMQKSGMVTIIASAAGLCGSSLLTITAANPQDWTDGSARYNDGVVINRVPRNNGGASDAAATSDASTPQQAACTNCHGDTASGPYKTVQHTPEQTGGFSDTDLTNIFENGVVPMGGYFDANIVSYAMWQMFHKWDVGTSSKGLVVYLRSLTPAAQTGAANFGGQFDGGTMMRPDGGGTRGDGGFTRGDGGGMFGGDGGGAFGGGDGPVAPDDAATTPVPSTGDDGGTD